MSVYSVVLAWFQKRIEIPANITQWYAFKIRPVAVLTVFQITKWKTAQSESVMV